MRLNDRKSPILGTSPQNLDKNSFNKTKFQTTLELTKESDISKRRISIKGETPSINNSNFERKLEEITNSQSSVINVINQEQIDQIKPEQTQQKEKIQIDNNKKESQPKIIVGDLNVEELNQTEKLDPIKEPKEPSIKDDVFKDQKIEENLDKNEDIQKEVIENGEKIIQQLEKIEWDERRNSTPIIKIEIIWKNDDLQKKEIMKNVNAGPVSPLIIPKLQLEKKLNGSESPQSPNSPISPNILSPKSPTSKITAFVPILGQLDTEDEETYQYSIENFVNSFIEKSDRKFDESKLIIIQSAILGYLERKIKIIETPRYHENEEIQVYQPKPIIEEEEIINELFEEDIICENPLFDEEFATLNQLYEELESINNPLFEENSFKLYTNYEEELAFYQELKQNLNIRDIKIKKSIKKNSFYGDDLIHLLQNKYYICEEDATLISQNLLNDFVIKNQKVYKRIFEREDLYYFIEECQQENVLNLPEKNICLPKFENQDEIIYKIYNNWRMIIHQYATISSKKVLKISYALLSTSALFDQLKKDVVLLHKFDPFLLIEVERKAFFINIYNILTIHALILCGRPNSVITKTLYFKTKYYVIGNYKISLDDIEHLILRGGKQIPPQLFIRCFGTKNINELSIPLDPRIHFTLHKGTISSPILRFYNPNNLDQDIEISTMIYLQNSIQSQNDEIYIPRIFNTFKDDFGSLKDILEFIYHHANTNQKKFITELKTHSNFTIRFSPENLSINEKDKSEILSDQKVEYREILDNLQYRSYFKKFCKKEFNDENIICYEEIENFRKIPDGNMRFIKAKEIYSLYLKSGSKREINITANPVQKVNEEIQKEENILREKGDYISNLKIELFDEILNNITTSLIDAYCRFKLTPEYQEMILLQLENKLKQGTPQETSLEEKKVSPYYKTFFETYDKAKEMIYVKNEDGELSPSLFLLDRKSARKEQVQKTNSFILQSEPKEASETKTLQHKYTSFIANK